MHLLFALLTLAHGSNFDSHVRGQMSLTRHALTPHFATAMNLYPQAIDHSSQSETFNQRYWVDNEFASGPDAPVIYHMCGEGDVEQGYFLNDSAFDWARALGARIVFLEHRYYGQSQPFADFSTKHLSYLTLDNVLEDLAGFQVWLTNSQGWTGKWIAVGGSYSGTLAALYRQRHPELVVGALASSAPMISGLGAPSDDAASETDERDDSRPWTYQACTELGYWEADAPGRNADLLLPSPAACAQIFPGAPAADAKMYNAKYDAPFLGLSGNAPTNILFTFGGEDVWTNLGLITQTVKNPGISLLMIDGAGHHFDLNPSTADDSAAVLSAREVFLIKARVWLGTL